MSLSSAEVLETIKSQRRDSLGGGTMRIRSLSHRCTVFRSTASRFTAIFLLLALLAPPVSARGRGATTAAKKIIGAAMLWITKALGEYALERGVDKATGQDLETQLEILRRDLEDSIRQADAESVGPLREQLEVTNSELEMVTKLLQGSGKHRNTLLCEGPRRMPSAAP